MTPPSGAGEEMRRRFSRSIHLYCFVFCCLAAAAECRGENSRELYRLSPVIGNSQDDRNTLAFATSLFEEGDYYRSISEFKRYKFTTADSASLCSVDFMMGLSYFNAQQWTDAYASFYKISETKRCSFLADAAVYKIGESLFQQAEYQSSAARFASMQFPGDSLDFSARARAMEGWCYLKLRDFPQAIEVYRRLMSSNGRDQYGTCSASLVSYLKNHDRIPRRSPALTGLMSVVLPGAGQMYCKRYADGALALVINGALGYIAYNSYQKEYYAGEIIAAYFGLVFYGGNIYAARAAAHRFNQHAEESFLDHAEKILAEAKLKLNVRKDDLQVLVCFE